MKKFNKTKWISYILSLTVVLSTVIAAVPVSAETQSPYRYGYVMITFLTEDDWGNCIYEIKLFADNGNVKVYTAADTVLVGNETDGYKNYANNELDDLRLIGEAIGFSLNENAEITSIQLDNSYTSYKGVAYDAANERFVCNSETQGLAVYMIDSDSYVRTPFLDENCIYNIEVNNYGVIITNYDSLYDTIITKESVAIEKTINADFNSYNIGVAVDDITAGTTLHAQLCDQMGNIIEEKTCAVEDMYAEIDFDVSNKMATYDIEIFVADKNGDIISNIYTESISITEIDTKHGYIDAALFSVGPWNDKCLEIRVIDNWGKGVVYMLADMCRIEIENLNEVCNIYSLSYKEGEALAEALSLKQVKFVFDYNGFICAIAELESYTVTTPTETDKGYEIETYFENVSENSKIIYVIYENGELSKIVVRDYEDCSIPYPISRTTGRIEVMVWDGMTTMIPLTEKEVIAF